jgi:hypothetical protein
MTSFTVPSPSQPDIDLEIEILGAILSDPQHGCDRIRDLITAEMFAIEQHRIIFQAIAQTPAPHDLISVLTTLQKSKKLKRAGGQKALSRLMQIVGTHNLEGHAALLLEAHRRREAARITSQIEEAVADGNLSRAAALGESLSDVGLQGIAPGGELISEVDRLIARNLSGSELQAAKADLSGRYRLSPRDVEAIVQERMIETDRADDRQDIRREIERLQAAQSSSIALHEVLPRDLAQPINQLATWMGLRPEAYLLTLLPVIGSLQKNGSELSLCPETDWTVTPNLYTTIVAESAVGKSPIGRAIVTKPLSQLQKQADDDYQTQLLSWQENCKRMKQEDPDAVLPTEPQRRLFTFSRATGESIPRQRERRPDDGLLFAADELKAIFGSQNQYRSGRGSDAEDLLEYFDGRSPTVLRADGVQCNSGLFNFSITGGIQPDVLAKLMGDGQDSNGGWARFLFVHQPPTIKQLPDRGAGKIHINDLLAANYQRIDQLPAMSYRLTDDAYKLFQEQDWRYKLEYQAETSQAMRAYLGKAAGKVGKIAVNLHVLDWATSNDSLLPSEEVSRDTIARAIRITDMAIEQIRSLYAGVAVDNYSSIASHLATVLDNLDRRGSLTPRDVATTFARKYGANTATIREWFRELDAMGLATLEITGKRSWKLLPLKNVAVSQNVAVSATNVATSESLTDKGIHEFVVNVATNSFSPENSHPLPIAPEPDPYDQFFTVGKSQQLQQTPETLTEQVIEVLQPTATNVATIEKTATIEQPQAKPIAVKIGAGILDKKGQSQAWRIVGVGGGCYSIRLSGTSETKTIAIGSVDPQHIVFE